MQAATPKDKTRRRTLIADIVAYVVLTFSAGLAVSLALAGAVLLLAGASSVADLPTISSTGVR